MQDFQINKQYFKPLTGVRALAAFMVYFHHFNPLPVKFNKTLPYYFINELHVGVTFFFVLSGFLIAYRYSDMNNFNFKKYMTNRIARIYPIYFILTTIIFIILRINNHNNNYVFLYILNITFLKGFFKDFLFSGIAQGWSLTVEEVFYILAPVFFIFLRKSRFYLVILPSLSIIFGIILVLIFSKLSLCGFFKSFEFMFNYTFFGRCTEFFIGIGLALFYKSQSKINNFNYFTYLGIINIILSIILLIIFKENNDYGIRTPAGKIVNNFILPLTGISIFYYGLIKEETFISKILSSKIFILLGKSSYIFYLIHVGIFAEGLYQIAHRLIISLLILVFISVFLFKFVEEPLNNFIRNKFS